MKHIILIALSLSLFAFSLHATKPDNAENPTNKKLFKINLMRTTPILTQSNQRPAGEKREKRKEGKRSEAFS